ncbi:MAG: hypothetical protein PHD70_07825 [Anaerostipes sp.]|nr:hypothetical protein [Anaerostipes sp.]
MKKLFKYYSFILPVTALLYGSYMISYIIQRESGAHDNDIMVSFFEDKLLYGWNVVFVIFLLLLAVVIYQLQEDERWQYIYSFPTTRKKIFKDIFAKINVSLVAAGVIYGVFYVIKCRQLSNWDNINNIFMSGMFNFACLLAKAMIGEAILFSCRYVWQGILIAVGTIFAFIPTAVGNLGYLLDVGFNVNGDNLIFKSIFYDEPTGLKLPIELGYIVKETQHFEKALNNTWVEYCNHYIEIRGIGILLFGMIGFVCYQISKNIFGNLKVETNRKITRLDGKWNHMIVGIFITLLLFHGITNQIFFGSYNIFEYGSPGLMQGFTTMLMHKRLIEGEGNATTVLIIAASCAIVSCAILFAYKRGRRLYEKHRKA